MLVRAKGSLNSAAVASSGQQALQGQHVAASVIDMSSAWIPHCMCIERGCLESHSSVQSCAECVAHGGLHVRPFLSTTRSLSSVLTSYMASHGGAYAAAAAAAAPANRQHRHTNNNPHCTETITHITEHMYLRVAVNATIVSTMYLGGRSDAQQTKRRSQSPHKPGHVT
jgi:hypothetical protein